MSKTLGIFRSQRLSRTLPLAGELARERVGLGLWGKIKIELWQEATVRQGVQVVHRGVVEVDLKMRESLREWRDRLICTGRKVGMKAI